MPRWGRANSGQRAGTDTRSGTGGKGRNERPVPTPQGPSVQSSPVLSCPLSHTHLLAPPASISAGLVTAPQTTRRLRLRLSRTSTLSTHISTTVASAPQTFNCRCYSVTASRHNTCLYTKPTPTPTLPTLPCPPYQPPDDPGPADDTLLASPPPGPVYPSLPPCLVAYPTCGPSLSVESGSPIVPTPAVTSSPQLNLACRPPARVQTGQ